MKFAVFTLMALCSAALASADNVSTSCASTLLLPPVTVTRCNSQTSTASLGQSSNTLVYTTAYQQFCPTGLEYKTYTITQTCDKAPCTTPAGNIPSGFTVAASTCSSCGSEPITKTLTFPVMSSHPSETSTSKSVQEASATSSAPQVSTTATTVCSTCGVITSSTTVVVSSATKESSVAGLHIALLILYAWLVL